jgi:hypothetical protein
VRIATGVGKNFSSRVPLFQSSNVSTADRRQVQPFQGWDFRQRAICRAFHVRLFIFKPFGLGISSTPPPFGGGREGANCSPSGLGDSSSPVWGRPGGGRWQPFGLGGLLLPRLGEVGRGPMAGREGVDGKPYSYSLQALIPISSVLILQIE